MSFASENTAIDEGRSRRCGRRWRARWTPVEITAMVVGFAVYWPLGLIVLMCKLWQKQESYPGDLFSFAKAKIAPLTQAQWGQSSGARNPWRPFAETPTGNAAFDEWRAKELARLEEERQKIVSSEREFAQHLDKLRRARDREEFEQFMRERRARRDGSVDV